jgi:hypothetical protein
MFQWAEWVAYSNRMWISLVNITLQRLAKQSDGVPVNAGDRSWAVIA